MHGIQRILNYSLLVRQIQRSGLSIYILAGQFIYAYPHIRIWDADNKRKQKTVIVVKSKERGARTKVTACNYSPDGNLIGGGELRCFLLPQAVKVLIISRVELAVACLDGALHMWQTSSNFVRPNLTIENAHLKGTETGSLVFSVDRQTVLTRGGDDTVKRRCFVYFGRGV